jgi:hypothetical protein
MRSAVIMYTGNGVVANGVKRAKHSHGWRLAAIVLDIEGTVAPISFVADVMFPHARDNVRSWLEQHYDSTQAVADIHAIRTQVGVSGGGADIKSHPEGGGVWGFCAREVRIGVPVVPVRYVCWYSSNQGMQRNQRQIGVADRAEGLGCLCMPVCMWACQG